MTDETLLQPGEGTPAPEIEANPAPEAPPPEPVAAAPESEAPPEQKPAEKKSPVAQLQGRVGYLTKELHAKDAAIEAERRRAEAALALLAKQGMSADAETPPAPTHSAPKPAAQLTEDDFERAVDERAREREFTRECNEVYTKGRAEIPDFELSVENLKSMGFAKRDVVEAALASGEAAKVLHHLGSDLDEAARISSLPPARMGAEIAKLALKISAPKKEQVSSAPAPIKPVGGSAKPVEDVYDSNLSDADYYALRAKQGAPYARAPRA